jgi:phytoene/squalene synthetase
MVRAVLPDEIVEAARDGAPNFYLSALLAPRAVRSDLITFAAFIGEIDRVPFLTGDPNLGLIRLQWWIDAFEKTEPGSKSGHPVADAALELAAARRDVSRFEFAHYANATAYLLGTDEPSDTQLGNYLSGTSGLVFDIWGRLIGETKSPEAETLTNLAAAAYGRAVLAHRLVRLLGKGRCPLPLDYFDGRDPRQSLEDEARRAVAAALSRLSHEAQKNLDLVRRGLSAERGRIVKAMLPLVLVEPVLQALSAPGRDVLRDVAEISPFSRVMRLGLASLRGRI